ncbi:glycoside hydrolase family 76 protein [Specibacter sp. NPDC057265]|uniref:glycoside hydrolase family 76 protein n=1 Tax=Specibacter sp. NPDC057265 TaxID=3346075 RepID=UPI003640C094
MTSHRGPSQQNDSKERSSNNWALDADQAQAQVHARFGHRLAGVPGTWIGSPTAGPLPGSPKTPQGPFQPWHYWWQAHYLDAVLDTAFRQLRHHDRPGARAELRRAEHLLRGIMVRNFGRFTNDFYDDMAWLALAAGRLNRLSLKLLARPSRLATSATRSLTRQLHHAHDDVLGGGLHWSRKRDYKNTPVNGPAALHFARTGERRRAQEIIHWLRLELFDPEIGLYVDGIHPCATGRNVETTIYTYNQGPVLGALLELGRSTDLGDAVALIAAIHRRLFTAGQGLQLESGDDGCLFTGILVRYLALAAQDPRLPELSRQTASAMVTDTAAALRDTGPTQLSGALQRWMVLSAAAAV